MTEGKKSVWLPAAGATLACVILSFLLLLGSDGTGAWFNSESHGDVAQFSAAPVFPDFVISDIAVSPDCTSALVTWSTNRPASSVIEWSQVSGGPYSSHSDPAPVQDHSYPITGIASGAIVYYRVSSILPDGVSAESDELSFTAPGGKPALSLHKVATYWHSNAEYANRILTVDFKIVNDGPFAKSPVIVGIINTNGVITYGTTTINDIPAGSFSSFSVKYLLPQGVTQYKTQIFIRVEDECGVTYSYPGPYPGA